MMERERENQTETAGRDTGSLSAVCPGLHYDLSESCFYKNVLKITQLLCYRRRNIVWAGFAIVYSLLLCLIFSDFKNIKIQTLRGLVKTPWPLVWCPLCQSQPLAPPPPAHGSWTTQRPPVFSGRTVPSPWNVCPSSQLHPLSPST